jgi:SAM-dependent methyltransferase
MYEGFPAGLLATLRCPADRGALTLQAPQTIDYVINGTLTCRTCGSQYAVRQGIVCFLNTDALHSESDNERLRRDDRVKGLDPAWEGTEWNQLEIEPTLEASEPLGGALVLEIGAGTGRFTVRMAKRGAMIVAVDLSLESLRNLADRVEPGWAIGLVHADCTQFATAPAAFDLVASTLISNLPTKEHLAATLRMAANSCKPNGKFVFSTHFFSWRNRLRGEPRSGYYDWAPIYRHFYTVNEIVGETRAAFADVKCHPIQIAIPLARRLRLPVLKLSRAAERLPLLNQLGDLLLVSARQPLELHVERGQKVST